MKRPLDRGPVPRPTPTPPLAALAHDADRQMILDHPVDHGFRILAHGRPADRARRPIPGNLVSNVKPAPYFPALLTTLSGNSSPNTRW